MTKVSRPHHASRERDFSYLEDGKLEATMAGELLEAQKEILALKKLLDEKNKELEREKTEKVKLRNENAELKKKVERLTQIARNGHEGHQR